MKPIIKRRGHRVIIYENPFLLGFPDTVYSEFDCTLSSGSKSGISHFSPLVEKYPSVATSFYRTINLLRLSALVSMRNSALLSPPSPPPPRESPTLPPSTSWPPSSFQTPLEARMEYPAEVRRYFRAAQWDYDNLAKTLIAAQAITAWQRLRARRCARRYTIV